MIRQTRNHRGNQRSCWNAGGRQRVNRCETALGMRRTGLQLSDEISIKRGNGNKHQNAINWRQLSQKVDITCYQFILRDDHDRIAELDQYFEASSS